MNILAQFLVLVLLTLIQVTVLPINLGFAAVVAGVLFIEKFEFVPWLVVLSLLVSLFGNLNFGIVLVGFTLAIFLILILRKIIPENRITKILIVLISLPLATASLFLMSTFTK